MRLRRLLRVVSLVFALAFCAMRYGLARMRGPLPLERRAQWMQQAARSLLERLGAHCVVEGELPAGGLVASNHLGYLDIIAYAAAMPCCFVSKREVVHWPVFGSLARAGATIFLDRGSQAGANAAAAQISERLPLPIPVLLFPEGTSTCGNEVLPFHPRLFHPAIRAGAPITAAAICYLGDDGAKESELCWFGDAPFLPHLWKVLGMRAISAHIHFSPARIYTEARTAARETHAAVVEARTGMRTYRAIQLPETNDGHALSLGSGHAGAVGGAQGVLRDAREGGDRAHDAGMQPGCW
jgi:lyso-ornithine lipid O-acyltransferase